MKSFKKFTALFMSFVIVLTMLCVSAYASDGEQVSADIKRISVSINGDTATQRGFCWYTPDLCDSIVKLYIDGDDVTSSVTCSVPVCSEWEGSYLHKVTVSDLEPGQTYNFKVGDGKRWSDIGTFTTDNGDDKVNFIAIADVQAGNLNNFMKGARALSAAFDYMPDYDFVTNLGDLTNDSNNEEWNYYDEAFAELNLNYSIAPIAGNHDGFGVWNWFNNMFNLDTSESVQTLNGVNYSFDYGNAHFAVLNTNDLVSVSHAQLNWLRNDMNSTDKDWKIVFMHKSPYSLGKDAKWPDALFLQKSVAAVCDEVGVDLVMSGHDHMYLRTKPLIDNAVADGGTTYVLSGTAGSKRYEVRSFLADKFLDTSFIDAMTVQKDGYANYWDGEDWDQSLDTNVGSCFNTISIDGGTLTLKSYIIADEKDENGNDVITQIDTYTVSKETGKNEITFEGDNTTSSASYWLGVIPSFLSLATYTLTEWLPKFLGMLPKLIYVYATEGVF